MGGSECVIRLGPEEVFQVTVPEGASPGDAVTFEATDGRQQTVYVPVDAKPGDTFEVVPPAVMVEVPKGSSAGDIVKFNTEQEGGMNIERTAMVPEGKLPGQLFPVLIEPADASQKPL